jgi:predicted O-methyltransferase YrrM
MKNKADRKENPFINLKMSFSGDWFSNNIDLWKKHLHNFQNKPVHFLEIGTFEGKSALWMLENILTHKDSHLTCVDNFIIKTKDGKDAYPRLVKHLHHLKNKVTILKGESGDVLKKLPSNKFDFIYIDANHHSQNVLEDAVLAFPLLKPHGILIFDDYTHNKEHDVNCPRLGIDAFLNIYSNDIKVLFTGWQVILMKRKQPLKRRPCYSEYYEDPTHVPWWWSKKQ